MLSSWLHLVYDFSLFYSNFAEYKTDPYESEALDCDSRVNATTTNTSLMPKTITPTNTSHGESKRSPEAKDSKNIVKELFLEEVSLQTTHVNKYYLDKKFNEDIRIVKSYG